VNKFGLLVPHRAFFRVVLGEVHFNCRKIAFQPAPDPVSGPVRESTR
jgi:hypothetical protein